MNLTPKQNQDNCDAMRAWLEGRPKPKPKTRPWDFNSRPREVVWVYKKGFISDRMITVWKDDCVEVGTYETVKYDTLLSEWLQRDGSPCGIIEP